MEAHRAREFARDKRRWIPLVLAALAAFAAFALRRPAGTESPVTSLPSPLSPDPASRPPTLAAPPQPRQTEIRRPEPPTAGRIRVAIVLHDRGNALDAATAVLSGRFPSTWTEATVDGAAGAFLLEVDDLQDPRLVLTCRAPGHFSRIVPLASLRDRLEGDGSERTIRLELAPASEGSIRARIVDASTHAAVIGAEAFVVEGVAGRRAPRALAVSDVDGRVDISTRDSTARVYVRRAGYLPAELSTSEPPKDLGDVPLVRAAEPPSLVVRVVPSVERGTHVRVARLGPDPASAEFLVLSGGVPGSAYEVATRRLGPALSGTGSDQRWANGPPLACAGMLPGRYLVTARNASIGVASRVVELHEGASEVELELRAGATIRVTGDDAGTARWSLEGVEWALGSVATTEARLSNVLPGEYVFRAAGLERSVVVPAAGDLVLDLKPSSRHVVRGLVLVKGPDRTTSPGTGLPIRIPGTTVRATTDADGRFVIPDLAPGSYRLLVDDRLPAADARDSFDIATSATTDIDIGRVVVLAKGLSEDPDAPK